MYVYINTFDLEFLDTQCYEILCYIKNMRIKILTKLRFKFIIDKKTFDKRNEFIVFNFAISKQYLASYQNYFINLMCSVICVQVERI